MDNKRNSLNLAAKICSYICPWTLSVPGSSQFSLKNMLGYLSLDIICSSKPTVFLELRCRKTVRFSGQIMSVDKYPSIFSCQMKAIVYVFTKSVDSNFWYVLIGSRNLEYPWVFTVLRLERKMARHFAKVSEEEIVAIIETEFFYPSDLVNTKTTMPLRVGEEQWIYTSTLCILVYIHHYSPPL